MINESPAVLSWDEGIFLMHHRHHQEINPTHTIVHLHMISIVISGEKEIIDGDGKTIVPAGAGFFMKKGAYRIAEK